MEVYFWNQPNQVFELKSVPDWSGYETMISTAKQVQDILNGECKHSDYRNIFETLNRVSDYYGNKTTANGADFYAKNLLYASDLALKIYNDYASFPDYTERLITRLKTAIRGLANGVVYDGNANPSYGNNFYDILNPQSDIYEYNGRKFYLWDGWHSSRKVMAESADKQFNNKNK